MPELRPSPRLVALDMVILRQPTACTCGQTCVAMLTGQTVDEVCATIGKTRGTKPVDLALALRRAGFECPDKLVLLPRAPLAETAIVKVAPPRGRPGYHWVLWRDGEYVDPQVGLAYGPEEFVALTHTLGWRVTSLLPVSPP